MGELFHSIKPVSLNCAPLLQMSEMVGALVFHPRIQISELNLKKKEKAPLCYRGAVSLISS